MTSIETGPSWAERLNPRHWTLVWKLVIVGLVPAVLALTLGVLRITDQAGSAADLSRGAQWLQVHTLVAGTADGLRQERDQATRYIAGNRADDRAPLGATASRSDELIAGMRKGLAEAGATDQSTSVAVAQADDLLNQLTALRGDVDGAGTLTSVRGRYDRVIESVDGVDRTVLRAVRVPDTAGQVDALTALQDVAAQLAVQHTLLADAIRAGSVPGEDATAARDADVLIFAQNRAYQAALTPDQLRRYGDFLSDPSTTSRQALAGAVIGAAGKPGVGGVTPASWDDAYDAARRVLDGSADAIGKDLVAAGNTAAQQAGDRAGINSVILLLGLLLGITLAVLVARSLIRSLRLLRGAALDVAERRLPNAVESMRAGATPDVTVEPVPIRSRDEVGQVARAFDAVHGQAIRLAADQAALQTNVSAMFVNLSRRSQALVERQLQLIEALESNEQDADQLSNLFQLDHLATRMRRNSENLLVLAGTDLTKRNVSPVPMVDVLRAAVSEVEMYQRVVVQAPPAASVAGRTGSDLVHLLAELLDNATNFSHPESQVVMSATRTPDGAMIVEISDRGVGMADHELADANERLVGPTDVDVSASRRMGLFVVGRLAARHGIAVRLSSAAAGPGSGLTAWVTVPSSLIPTGMPLESPRRPAAVPMAAGAAQGGPGGDARGRRPDGRPDVNGAPAFGSLSALATGPDGAPAGPDDAPAGGQGTLFAGRPPVNGSAAGGLPTRTPGSSLRPDSPPPTSAPPGGFFDDGSGRGLEHRERPRAPGEQARLDQEAAARRDQVVEPGLPTDDPNPGQSPQGSDDERAPADDERSSGTGPRPLRDLAPGQPSPGQTPPERNPGWSTAGPGEPAAQEPVTGGPPAPRPGGPRPPAAERRTPPADRPAEGRAEGGQDLAGLRPDEDTTPPQGQPRQAPLDIVDAGRADPPAATLPFRTDQQQRDQPSTASPGWSTPAGAPRGPSPQAPPPAPTPAGRAQDELFAPRVPSLDPSATLPGHDPGASAFDLGETTPIFEEIASAWFRSNRPVPVSWESDTGSQPAVPPLAADAEADGADRDDRPAVEPAVGRSAVTPATGWSVPEPSVGPGEAETADLGREGAPPVVGVPQVPAARTTPEGPREAVAPAARTSAAEFASAADEGWLAASTVSERSDELTAAGLPKRRPRARLIPGSAGSAVLAPMVTSARSAETIRGRLASYQQGVRQGRESRLRGGPDATDSADHPAPPAPADADHDEESS